ncbi:uncharacterized protein [Nicotiana sylvestris]|uniref:uncharacterized protein n=1 Tax=Nicotiana sylvestris TaxID=4096 RepID=UPI00388CC73F
MSTPSENPSSQPKETTPTPSITPSTTPTSKKGRFKMMARKLVAGEEQIKKINEQLKAIRDEESFKYVTGRGRLFHLKQIKIKKKESKGAQGDTRGKGKEGVTESSPTPTKLTKETGAMVLWNEDYVGEEKGGSGFGDESAAEELVRLRKRFFPFVQEEEFKKSKRKAAAKGKKKVSEPVKAVDIKEMDLVLWDEDKEEEVEAVTPKKKKRKTSKKKSPSKTADAETSTLAKRTRSARKSRKVQIVEEEESKEEEESDEE